MDYKKKYLKYKLKYLNTKKMLTGGECNVTVGHESDVSDLLTQVHNQNLMKFIFLPYTEDHGLMKLEKDGNPWDGWHKRADLCWISEQLKASGLYYKYFTQEIKKNDLRPDQDPVETAPEVRPTQTESGYIYGKTIKATWLSFNEVVHELQREIERPRGNYGFPACSDVEDPYDYSEILSEKCQNDQAELMRSEVRLRKQQELDREKENNRSSRARSYESERARSSKYRSGIY